MFKIALSATYLAPVKGEIPNEKGKIEKFDFMAEFKRCDTDELEDLRKLQQRDVVREVLQGWSGLVDESNQSVAFNEASREAVLAIPQAVIALAESFWASIYKAREKN